MYFQAAIHRKDASQESPLLGPPPPVPLLCGAEWGWQCQQYTWFGRSPKMVM